MTTMRGFRRGGLAVTLSAVMGCASAPPPPPVVAAPPPPPPRPKLAVASELGQIDEGATKKTFERVSAGLMGCYTSGLSHLEYMAGDVKFYLRVKPDGHLRWVYLEESSLGDRDTETCMLGVLSSASWPLPEGGEAEVHHGLSFDAPPGVRPPTAWSADRVTPGVTQKSTAASACKQHGSAPFRVTAYVAGAKGAGHVIAAGAAAPSAPAAADVDCLLGVVGSLKLPSPGSYPAKVSFSL